MCRGEYSWKRFWRFGGVCKLLETEGGVGCWRSIGHLRGKFYKEMEDCWKERRTEGGNRVHCAREKTYQVWPLRFSCLSFFSPLCSILCWFFSIILLIGSGHWESHVWHIIMRPFHHLLSKCHLPLSLLLMILDWPIRRPKLIGLSPWWDKSDCRTKVWLRMIGMTYQRLACPPSFACQTLSIIVRLVVPRSTWDYTAQSWEHTG